MEVAREILERKYRFTYDSTHNVPSMELKAFLKKNNPDWVEKNSGFFCSLFKDLKLGLEIGPHHKYQRTGIQRKPRERKPRVYKHRPPPSIDYIKDWFDSQTTHPPFYTTNDLRTFFPNVNSKRLGTDLLHSNLFERKRRNRGVIYLVKNNLIEAVPNPSPSN